MFLSLGQMPVGLPALAGREPGRGHAPIVSGVDCGGAVSTPHRTAAQPADARTVPVASVGLGERGRFDRGVAAGTGTRRPPPREKSVVIDLAPPWAGRAGGRSFARRRRSGGVARAAPPPPRGSVARSTPQPTPFVQPRAEHNWLPACLRILSQRSDFGLESTGLFSADKNEFAMKSETGWKPCHYPHLFIFG